MFPSPQPPPPPLYPPYPPSSNSPPFSPPSPHRFRFSLVHLDDHQTSPDRERTPSIDVDSMDVESRSQLFDIANVPKPFKNPNWKPSARRNKSVKQILAESARKEASVLASQAPSSTATPGTQTPADASAAAEAGTPAGNGPTARPSMENLATAVLDKNLKASAAGGAAPAANTPSASAISYTSIEAPPSVKPKKKYCDITGLPAPYTDPKTGLRYHDKEIFQVVRSLPQGVPEQYLEARGANTVLK
ncbi:hypothetical protein VTO42DRAFT_1074 [Malbranchea cinnamomea]